MVRIEPFHQGPARVQRELQIRIALEQIKKRAVAVLIGLLEDAVEVPDRLMVVKNKQEADRVRHRSEDGQQNATGGWRFAARPITRILWIARRIDQRQF